MKFLNMFILMFFVSISAHAVVIRGNVSDETGKPVVNTPIYLVMKKTEFSLKGFRSEVIDSKSVVTYTDKDGLYTLDVNVDPYFNKFYLFFFGEGFSFAHYVKPEIEKLNSKVKKMDEIYVNRVYAKNPDWDKILIAVSSLDPASRKYKMLTVYGFPDKRDVLDNNREKWYYFQFQKEIVIEN